MKDLLNPPAIVVQDEQGEQQLIERAKNADSKAAWDVGECAAKWTERYANGRTDADFAEQVGSSQDAINRRRRVYLAFYDLSHKLNLTWTHFREALPWCGDDDTPTTEAIAALEWASKERASIKAMKDHYQTLQKDWYTIAEWNALSEDERLRLFYASDKKMNKQDSTSIEWAQWSWNPITGCKHDCPYCYARDIANRFYKQKFEPSIYPARFNAPKNTNVPEKADEDVSFRNVFTGSMADIFGRWVPDEWVHRVIGVVKECPQWNFLFLTKFPQRVHEYEKELPSNAWMGTTVDCQDRVANAEKAFSKMSGGTKWLSIEPMLTPLRFERLDLFDWVVIGGASPSAQTPKWTPPFDWISDLHQQARDAGCKIYHKDNLGLGDDIRLREFPWTETSNAELPEKLKYLGIK